MTRLDAWRGRLAAALAGRGRKIALARYLAGGDPARLNGQVVQIARVLNQGVGCAAEFLLACEEWMRNNPPDRVKTRTAQKKSTDGKNSGFAKAGGNIVMYMYAKRLPVLHKTRITKE